MAPKRSIAETNLPVPPARFGRKGVSQEHFEALLVEESALAQEELDKQRAGLPRAVVDDLSTMLDNMCIIPSTDTEAEISWQVNRLMVDALRIIGETAAAKPNNDEQLSYRLDCHYSQAEVDAMRNTRRLQRGTRSNELNGPSLSDLQEWATVECTLPILNNQIDDHHKRLSKVTEFLFHDAAFSAGNNTLRKNGARKLKEWVTLFFNSILGPGGIKTANGVTKDVAKLSSETWGSIIETNCLSASPLAPTPKLIQDLYTARLREKQISQKYATNIHNMFRIRTAIDLYMAYDNLLGTLEHNPEATDDDAAECDHLQGWIQLQLQSVRNWNWSATMDGEQWKKALHHVLWAMIHGEDKYDYKKLARLLSKGRLAANLVDQFGEGVVPLLPVSVLKSRWMDVSASEIERLVRAIPYHYYAMNNIGVYTESTPEVEKHKSAVEDMMAKIDNMIYKPLVEPAHRKTLILPVCIQTSNDSWMINAIGQASFDTAINSTPATDTGKVRRPTSANAGEIETGTTHAAEPPKSLRQNVTNDEDANRPTANAA